MRNLRLKKYCKDNFSHQIEARFLKRKSQLDIVVYSLIRVKDFNIAYELYLRIQGKEANFGDLAKEFSLGPERDSRGIVGPVFINQSHPELKGLIRCHKKDELIPPFRIDSNWLIVRVESITEVTLNEEMEDFLQKELFENWISEKSTEEMKILFNKFNIDAETKARPVYMRS